MKIFTDRQKEIINVSINLIAEKGIQGLTIKNISKKVGVTEPAIYRHFKNKRDIIVGILTFFKHTSKLLFDSIFASSNPGIREIESIFMVRCQQFSRNPELSTLIFSEEMFKNDKVLSEKVSSIITMSNEAITRIIDNAQKIGEVRNDIPKEQLGLIITGTLRLIITNWRLAKFSYELESEAHKLWDSIKILITDNSKQR